MNKATYCIFLLVWGFTSNGQEIKFTKDPSAGEKREHDMFGWQVSHNDDYIFISAPFDDGPAKKKIGALHIHKNGVNTQGFHQYLSFPDASPYTQFGKVFAHTGQYLVVAANKPVQTSFGESYLLLYRLKSNKWELVNIVNAGPFNLLEHAPSSLAMDDNTIVVGNSAITKAYPNGQLSIFTVNPATDAVTFQQRFTPLDVGDFDVIGHQVALHGNMMATSAIGADGGAVNSGTVWVYLKEGNTWKFFTEVKHNDAEENDRFGYALAVDYPTLAISAIRQGNGTANNKKCGAAYVYRLSGDRFNLEAKLTPDASANHYDYFGSSMDLHNNMLAVGANSDDFAGENAGAVYIFKRSANSWQQVNKLIGSGVNDGALFGNSVSVHNGDVLCSSHLEENDTSKSDHGAAYYYRNAETATGLKDVYLQTANAMVRTFPNPFTHTLDIRLSDRSKAESIIVYTISGSVMYELHAIPLSGELAIGTTGWPAGIYIVSIKGHGESNNIQVIKSSD